METGGDKLPRVLLIGVGDVTIRVAHLLATGDVPLELVIASRSLERATRFANLTKLAAFNLGLCRSVLPLELDLPDVDRTADDLSRVNPDVILLGASLQAARAIMDLPPADFETLDRAQLGPWLPMHLTLAYELMQAVRRLAQAPAVLNAAYPDAVGPSLAAVGTAPLAGIGNVGNIVPGITYAAAEQLGVPPADIGVKVVGHHYFSHHVHRFGEADGIPHVVVVERGGEKQEVDASEMYARLARGLRRQGGRDGQQITATSAARVIRALLGDEPMALHVPAPHGRVGGYPVVASSAQVALDLPDGMGPEGAEAVNVECQRLDGIDEIQDGGTIVFADPQMAVMQDLLGYDCKRLQVEDSRAAATELGERYAAFLRRRGLE